MNTCRILIADDHEMVRKGLRATLEETPGWTVVGEASNGREAVDLAAQLQPDIVVMDIGMPILNGLEATRAIRTASPELPVLVLTVYEAEHVVNEVVAAGAKGYLLKSDAGRELVQAITHLLEGHAYFTKKIADMILIGSPGRGRGGREIVGQLSRLSNREREIIQLLAEGSDVNEIGSKLRISPRTAAVHRSHIMQKIGTRSIAGVVRYAIRNNIIQA